MITVKNLTKIYSSGKGIKDISFEINEGEAFGYLGPNASGKTTTIRNLMGFLNPDSGICTIKGLDCRKETDEIQRISGYIPGEISFIDAFTGSDFLDLIAGMRRLKDKSRMSMLLDMFDLDPYQKIRHMSRGTRQKLAIVTSCMHDPSVMIFDEPSAGLDPLMQNIFSDFVREEIKRGKTILMSSHNFHEIDRTCNRAGILKEGVLQDLQDIKALREKQRRVFSILLSCEDDVAYLRKRGLKLDSVDGKRVSVNVEGSVDSFIKIISSIKVEALDVRYLNLEQVFMQYFIKES